MHHKFQIMGVFLLHQPYDDNRVRGIISDVYIDLIKLVPYGIEARKQITVIDFVVSLAV